ncbi:MAG: hypothetical protein FRX49_07594 [Trebouxia sp. A1-2]|nr:MAG: hypothetical protein FRX49_07594 [Trebouxia sp. A1-2]
MLSHLEGCVVARVQLYERVDFINGTYQGLAMMEVANNSNISDQLRVVHEPSQKLIAVVCFEGLLLQHLCLFGSDRGNDGHLHVTNASVVGQQQPMV